MTSIFEGQPLKTRPKLQAKQGSQSRCWDPLDVEIPGLVCTESTMSMAMLQNHWYKKKTHLWSHYTMIHSCPEVVPSLFDPCFFFWRDSWKLTFSLGVCQICFTSFLTVHFNKKYATTRAGIRLLKKGKQGLLGQETISIGVHLLDDPFNLILAKSDVPLEVRIKGDRISGL